MTNNPLHSIFKAYDVRGKVGSELNRDTVLAIGKAYADWLPTKGIIAVGHDMRPDSRELAMAFMNGLQEQGYDVWDIGLVTSDMIYFAVGKYKLAGGAVITASHNPGKDNGIKLYRDQVIAVGLESGLAEIRDNVLSNTYEPAASKTGSRKDKEITQDWINHCLGFVNNIKPYRIAVDAGNGMSGAILPTLLPRLPLEVEEMYFDLDGTFPNHEANPHKPENLQDLIKKVTENSFDFGIAFDGDGDRAAFVDDLGRPVLGTDLISMVAVYYLKMYPGSKIVHDVRTSLATAEIVRENGGEPVRTKAGRVNIGTLMRRIGSPFGGETTGHLFFKENYDADSGLIAALVVMQALSDSNKKLSELINEYRRYEMVPEINLTVSKDKEKLFGKLQEAFPDSKNDLLDGLTVWVDDSWFNLRASNTEPVMRLNAEAKTKKELDQLVAKVTDIITS